MNKNLNFKVENKSFCYFDDELECDTMGMLYIWEGAKKADELIQGWHLPGKAEWEDLIEYYGGDSSAYLKRLSTENGFIIQPSEVRLASGKYIAKKYKEVNYWSSSVCDTSYKLAFSVTFMKHLEIISNHNYPVKNACSVRFIRD